MPARPYPGAQSIYVRLLGTAGPSLNPNQAEAGLLVVAGAEVLLFDCGHGVPNRLAQLGRTNVSKVFLTHVHSDHTEGLPEDLPVRRVSGGECHGTREPLRGHGEELPPVRHLPEEALPGAGWGPWAEYKASSAARRARRRPGATPGNPDGPALRPGPFQPQWWY